MISRGGSQPQISRFYIGPTMKNIGQNLVFLSKKKKKKNTNLKILPDFGLLKWEMTILTLVSSFQTIPVGCTVQICD